MATATSSPCLASFWTSSPMRMLLILPRSLPSGPMRVSPGLILPARTRTPTMAGLLARNMQLGSTMNLAGNENTERLSVSVCLLHSSTHST